MIGSSFAITTGMKLSPTFSLIAATILATACASDIGNVDPMGGGGGGGGGAGADAGAAAICDEVTPIALELPTPPDLLLVVDKSGSMKDPIVGGQQKWAAMRGALNTTLTTNADGINFGLMLYPLDNECLIGGASPAVSPTSSTAITGALAGVSPEGGTPTHTALQSSLSYYQSNPVNAAGRYVLLATDGEPNCLAPNGDSSVTESIAAVAALKAAGIPTFVVGFGDGVNAATLQAMAVAGGQTQYYAADSPANLALALDAIADQVALPDCSFVLSESPPDASRLRLYFDASEVGRSTLHTEGWDYDAATNSVTVYGGSCTELQTGTVGEVRVDYGCESGPSID
jgi:hypothetical protein